MRIAFFCQNCAKDLEAFDHLVGRTLLCPKCERPFTVPAVGKGNPPARLIADRPDPVARPRRAKTVAPARAAPATALGADPFELTEPMAVQPPKPAGRHPVPPATPAEIESLENMSSDSLFLEETIKAPPPDPEDMLGTVSIDDLAMEGLAFQPGAPPPHAATVPEASAVVLPETISYDETGQSKRPGSVLLVALLNFLLGAGFLALDGWWVFSELARGEQIGVGPLAGFGLGSGNQQAVDLNVPNNQLIHYAGLGVDAFLCVLLLLSSLGLLLMRSWGRSLAIIYGLLSILTKIGIGVYTYLVLLPFFTELEGTGSRFIQDPKIMGFAMIGVAGASLLYPLLVLFIMLRNGKAFRAVEA